MHPDAMDCIRDAEGKTFIDGAMGAYRAGRRAQRRLGGAAAVFINPATVAEIKRQTAAMAEALSVVGLMNVQFAIQNIDGADVIYVLINPRASTVPFCQQDYRHQLARWRRMVSQSRWPRRA
jgi:carbamoyl-phosphate synthase large subunit